MGDVADGSRDLHRELLFPTSCLLRAQYTFGR
jgi:hypothetical protein